MNITEESFRQYLEVFHKALEDTAQRFIAVDHRARLLHLSFLPARIVGYVSTQYGVAYEYFPASQTTIEIVRGSSSIEDLFVQAPKELSSLGPFLYLNDSIGCGIFRLTLEGAFPFKMAGIRTSLSIGEVKFKYRLWSRIVNYAELYGNRSESSWTKDKAVSRAKDEVLAALVEINRAANKRISLTEYISRYKEKTVLLLGSYSTEGEERLQRIAMALRRLGYEPLLVREVPDHPHQSLEQKVATLGAISRFVVVDDSEKSGHLTEIEICKNNRWITILLRGHGFGSTIMTAGASAYSSVILECNYDPSAPQAALTESVAWAEKKLSEIQNQLSKVYPWRWTKA